MNGDKVAIRDILINLSKKNEGLGSSGGTLAKHKHSYIVDRIKSFRKHHQSTPPYSQTYEQMVKYRYNKLQRTCRLGI